MAQQESPPSYEMSSSLPKADDVTANVSKETSFGGPVGYDGPAVGQSDDIHLGLARPAVPAYDPQQPNAAEHLRLTQPQGTVWHTGQSTTVVVNQPAAAPRLIRPGPVHMIRDSSPAAAVCFNCDQAIVTYIYHESGFCTYASCVLLACIGCDLGCCLLPFCLDYFKDAVHKCPKCHVVLGKHKKLG